tara:strand:- start:334 stop:579 length:246 start_codon:yes stop_codon:yes gene_type:complete
MNMVKNLVQQGVEMVAEITENTSVKILMYKIASLEKENAQLKKENLALRQSIVDTVHKLQDMTTRNRRDLEKLEKHMQNIP